LLLPRASCGLKSSYLYLPCSRDYKHVHYTQLVWDGGVSLTFLPRLVSNHVLSISASQVAGITDVSHHTQPELFSFSFCFYFVSCNCKWCFYGHLQNMFSFLLSMYLGIELLGCRETLINLLKNCQSVFQHDCTILSLPALCEGSNFPLSCRYLLVTIILYTWLWRASSWFNWFHCGWWYSISFCVRLIIFIPSLKECLFSSFAHF
jgi:hypothetical protein